MTTITIAFHTPDLNIRGTCVALFDYANYNETILNNKSIIIYPKPIHETHEYNIVYEKFISRFDQDDQIFCYTTYDEMDKILKDNNINALYCIKYGRNDGIPRCPKNNIKLWIHSVFDLSEPHGDVYAGVSESLAKKYDLICPKTISRANKIITHLWVPHMIDMEFVNQFAFKNGWRKYYNIPENAIVFGRYGGMDTFNLPFISTVLNLILQRRPNTWFLFSNTPQIIIHPRVIYHSTPIVTKEDKIKFISTCDAHLECGTLGHTFGLAIGEFNFFNIPIIAYNGKVWNRAHLDILKDNVLKYENEVEFMDILLNFKKHKVQNSYIDYSPESVMQKFKQVFINSLD